MWDHFMWTVLSLVFWCASWKGWGCDLFILLTELIDSKGHTNSDKDPPYTVLWHPEPFVAFSDLLHDIPLVLRALSVKYICVQNILFSKAEDRCRVQIWWHSCINVFTLKLALSPGNLIDFCVWQGSQIFSWTLSSSKSLSASDS